MTASARYVVRRMNRKDVDLALDWAAAEGWNPGLADADAFYAADPNGFFVGELDGQPIAVGSAVAYDETFAFCGLYIVKAAYRDKGYGIQMTRARLDYCGRRNVGIDGVVAMQAKYAELGYRIAYRQVRYQGIAAGKIGRVVEAGSVPFDKLVAYDRRMFPAPRPTFLKQWIRPAHASALVRLEEGEIVGYGVIRPCRTGFKVGPLFANNAPIAEDLLDSLLCFASGSVVFLDIPLPNAAAIRVAESRGMTPVFETARMYLRGDPSLPLDHIFGITTFELG